VLQRTKRLERDSIILCETASKFLGQKDQCEAVPLLPEGVRRIKQSCLYNHTRAPGKSPVEYTRFFQYIGSLSLLKLQLLFASSAQLKPPVSS
jgi:hypothetical protein